MPSKFPQKWDVFSSGIHTVRWRTNLSKVIRRLLKPRAYAVITWSNISICRVIYLKMDRQVIQKSLGCRIQYILHRVHLVIYIFVYKIFLIPGMVHIHYEEVEYGYRGSFRDFGYEWTAMHRLAKRINVWKISQILTIHISRKHVTKLRNCHRHGFLKS